MTTVITSACSGMNGGRTSCATVRAVFHVASVFFDISIPLSVENQMAAPPSSVCNVKKRLLFKSTA
ncbi:MAG: hypothetical protein JO115_05730 [Pseudonocardiales bacterium]|nr:hypothetical protein [Pseudonocardiales bacterium]MBV9140404.1 hypothetical protein [Pseudonocardiales bacterium]